MALGFQDCCNSASYFYLNGIPATVSQFETYYITTSQGENFCATYVDVPALNYQPPTYNLLEMIQSVDCDDCKTSNNYSCPTSELILISQVNAGSIAGSDCQIKTIMPMYVECVSVNPELDSGLDGSVSLFVTGGTPPYFFYSAGTTTALGNNTSNGNVYPIFQNLGEGTYNITTVDSNGDFSITVSCTLNALPPQLSVTCVPTNISLYGADNGSINLLVSGGIPPYSYSYLGNNITLPISNLFAGTYEITVTDNGGEYQQVEVVNCTVNQASPVNYPENICMNFTLCSTQFFLQFERDSTDINYRASYICTNPSVMGLPSLSIFYGSNGWTTSSQSTTQNPEFSVNCGVNYVGLLFFAVSYTPTSTIPIGSWYTNQGGVLTGVSPIIVSPGLCPVIVILQSIGEFCTQTPTLLPTVVVEGVGGIGPYTFNITASNGQATSNTSPSFQLSNGTYSIVAVDSTGIQSQPVSFTVPTSNGVDVLFGIDSCVTSNLTTNWLNQISGPSANPVIQDGEALELNASMSNYIDFSFLPDGASFTGKIKISFSSNFTGGDSSHSLPTTSNIIVSPILTLNNITTNNVSTNYMNGVIPTNFTTPSTSEDGTYGTWYSNGQGNPCCNDIENEGLQWFQGLEWVSPTLTFNNTTVLSTIFSIYTKNMVPFYNYKCSNGNFCGAKLSNSVTIQLQNLTKVSGCINVSGIKKLIEGTVKNNSNGDAGWVTQPSPSC